MRSVRLVFPIATVVLLATSAVGLANEAATELAEVSFLELPIRSSSPQAQTQGLIRNLGAAVLSAHSANLNLQALTAPANLSGRSNERNPRYAGQTLLVNLPGESKLQRLHVRTVEETLPGVFSYTGLLDDDTLSLFTVTVKGTEMIGKIHSGTRLYVVQGQQGAYDIAEIDKTLVVQAPEEKEAFAKSQELLGTNAGLPTAKSSSIGNVRMLYYYTPEVRTRKGSPDVLASNIVSELNASLQASGISTDNLVTLAGMKVIGSNMSSDTKDIVLGKMRNRTFEFSSLTSDMQSTGADIAFAVVAANDNAICPTPNGQPCDYSRVGGVARGFHSPEPVGMVTDSYALGDLSAVHEIGHVLGGQHQVGQGSIYSGAQPDSRGYIDSSGTWQTMMGGYDLVSPCVFRTLNNQPSCVRLPRWSDPNSTHLGMPTGVLGQSNMTRALPLQMPTVAGYHFGNMNLPGPTGAIGLYRSGVVAHVSWSAASGTVTSYEVGVSEGAATVYTKIYLGPSTNISYQVKAGQFYNWQVRACNNSGCGPYTTRSGTI